MFAAGVIITLCFTLVICVQMLMIVTWSEKHAKVLKRLKALENRPHRSPPRAQLPSKIDGKLHVTFNGKSRTLDAQFKPSNSLVPVDARKITRPYL